MKLIKAENGYITTAFEFDDLMGKTREKVIQEHKNFLIETDREHEGCDDDFVIDNIIINGYLFHLDGELLPMTTYRGKHEFTGKHSIRIFEKEIFCTVEDMTPLIP